MSLTLMLIVLFAALLHALWNALLKGGADKRFDTILLTTGAAVVSACMLPMLPLPLAASWPYISASVLLHVAYYSFVGLAYRKGDLSYAYTLMRGSAPVLTALVMAFFIHEAPSFGGWVGIFLISLGILALAGRSLLVGDFPLESTIVGLLNALVIVAYTVVDGLGVRLGGQAVSYFGWLFFLTGIPFLAYGLIAHRPPFIRHLRQNWWKGLLAGTFTVASYGLALWAMTQTQVALVAALRETSVVFGALIATVYLREQFEFYRYAAAVLIAAGAVAMKVL